MISSVLVKGEIENEIQLMELDPRRVSGAMNKKDTTVSLSGGLVCDVLARWKRQGWAREKDGLSGD